MIYKLIKWATRRTNPCLKCLVYPICSIPRLGILMAATKCERYDKYIKRKERASGVMAAISASAFIGTFLFIIAYIAVTFIMGIIYQIKLIF